MEQCCASPSCSTLVLPEQSRGANTMRFRVTSPASDDARVSNVEIEQARTFTYTPPLPPEPEPITMWAASIPGAHH